ncbi:MAG: MutS-related protein [Anaerolineae bacterium]
MTHYTRQIERLTRHIRQLEATSDQISNWRAVLIFGGGIPLLILLFSNYALLFWGLLGAMLIGFAVLIVRHRQVSDHLTRFRAWRAIKQEMLARQTLDWSGIPEAPINAPMHPLETDLDLRDLHRLLNTAVSQAGTQRLRHWLLDSEPHLAIIEQRQKLVRELRERPTYRDKLTLSGRLSSAQIKHQINTKQLGDWLDSDVPLIQVKRWVTILSVLALSNVIAVVLAQFGVISPTLSAIMWGFYALIYISRAGLMSQLGEDGHALYELLSRLRAVMHHIERYDYAHMPNVRKLCAPVLEEQPSQAIKRLLGTLAASSLRGNPLIWLLLNSLLPWDLIFLQRLHQQKQQLSVVMPQWLDVWHELEVLNSLATFVDLNPHAHLPHVDQTQVLRGVALGHPLLPADQRVCNDFSVNTLGDLAILTGSNMAGKSSFLRTLGVNLALAYAGGAVIAQQLDVGLFRLFTCIRVTDSLDDGISYFYAEVKRLRALLDALQADHELPLFFLIDEIFKGTNNRERLIGSRAYITALAGEQGIGLIATHDLELTALANHNAHIRNLHFREQVQDGRMVFDYRLRDGASPTTNALKIMALEGLPINDSDMIHTTTPEES